MSFFLSQERCPPVLDDFLYICDDAYMRDDLIRMEIILLRSLVFDLGIPLSYRFLRRYAKVCNQRNYLLWQLYVPFQAIRFDNCWHLKVVNDLFSSDNCNAEVYKNCDDLTTLRYAVFNTPDSIVCVSMFPF